jgi:hypothetical protein
LLPDQGYNASSIVIVMENTEFQLDPKPSRFPGIPGEGSKSATVSLIFTILISAGCCAACYLAAGPSFDFFLGCSLFCAMICPILSAAAERAAVAWVICGCLWVVNIACWLVVGRMAGVTVPQWIFISLILAGMLGVMTSATRLLMRWRVAPVLAAAIVTVGQLLWLAWPIWLSPSIAGARLDWSVSLNPLLAMNGVLKDLGIWTEQPIAYNLTTLGQDVQYRLPNSAWPVILIQTAVIFVLTFALRRRRPKSEN